LGYGDGGRDDLFTREPPPPGYDSNPYGGGHAAGYQQPYDQGPGRAPLSQPAASQDYYHQSSSEDYERGFGSRIGGQDAGASRFFLPDERPQAQRPAGPPSGYAPAQPYSSGGYDPHGGGQHEPYDQHGGYDPRYAAQESWHGDEQAYHGREEQGGQLTVTHGDEFDEDFFGDEDDYEHDGAHGAPRRGRKKLIFAAVAAALVAGGGAYYLKSSGSGNRGTPVIQADKRPPKEAPGNPGGKQFPNGEKAIYERLRPDGTTQVAAAAMTPAAPVPPAFATPPASAGSSLEDRIDEALNRARRTGDAPPAGRPPGADQPTMVSSETYSPDGRRVDATARPVITPGISNTSNGLPYPFGNAPASVTATPAAPTPFKVASAPPAAPPPQQQLAPAVAAPAPVKGSARSVRAAPPAAEPPASPAAATAPGFYVSLKSAPDEKAIQKDLPALSDKYKSVLGDVQLSTKIADLGAKGVTYRAVAGPLGTKQEAQDLCQKIKGVGGDKACFVTN
jgi:hypothetical protein